MSGVRLNLKDLADNVTLENYVAMSDAICKYMAMCVAMKEQKIEVPREIIWENDGSKDLVLMSEGKKILDIKF